MKRRLFWCAAAAVSACAIAVPAAAYCPAGPNYSSCEEQEQREQQQREQEQQERMQQEQQQRQQEQQERLQQEQQQREQEQQERLQQEQQQRQQEREEQLQQEQQQRQQEREERLQQEQQQRQQEREERLQQEQQQRQQEREERLQQEQQQRQQEREERLQQEQQQRGQERLQQERDQQRSYRPENTRQPAGSEPKRYEPQRSNEPARNIESGTVRPRGESLPAGRETSGHLPQSTDVPRTNFVSPRTALGPAGPAGAQVRINRTTTAVASADHRGVVVTHQISGDSRIVASWHAQPNGQRRVEAYKLTKDAKAGTETRLYLDGHKVIAGRGFVTRSSPGRITMTTHNNGLRDASLPGGHQVFKERFGTIVDSRGHQQKTIVRTIFMRVHGGRGYTLRTPVQQVYGVVPYNGVVIYPYYPWAAPYGYYDPFYSRFYSPFTWAAWNLLCPVCLPNGVLFDGPPLPYAEPADVLGDMQIATGFDEGLNSGVDDLGPPDAPLDPGVTPVDLAPAAPDPEVADLANQVDQLRGEVQSVEADNQDLQAELADQKAETAALQAQTENRMAPKNPPPRAPVHISPEVRKQIHKQVKDAIGLEKSQQPLSLVDVIASADAQHYVFQVGEMMDATNEASGEPCTLTTGDLAKFAKVPGTGDAAAEMKIVTVKSGSCAAGSVVEVSMGDLQNMLDTFSQRLEANMRKAHDKLVQAAQKQKKA